MSSQDHLKEADTEARFEFKKEEKSAFKSEKGLTEETVRVISEDKDEPEWMLERAQAALQHPLRLVFVLRDDADRLLGETLLALEGGLLLLLELEAGLGVGVL